MKLISMVRKFCDFILASQSERINLIKIYNKIINKNSIADKYDYLEVLK